MYYTPLRPMTSHHVTYHVTAITCLFIVKKRKKKRNIKSKKIDKRKKKKVSIQVYYNISQTTRNISLPATNGNLVIKSTIKYIYDFFGILFTISFSTNTSV